MFEFVIDGPPVPWKAHGGFGKKSFNPRYEEKSYYQFELKKQYKHNLPLTVAVRLDCTFFLPVPNSASNRMKENMLAGRVKHIKRPDTSNLNKFLEDTLKGIVIKDDSQVIELCSRKLYAIYGKTVVRLELA